MNNKVFVNNTNFEIISCCLCGIEFALPVNFIENCKDSGDILYCPNGHTLSYNGRTKKRLDEEIKRSMVLSAQLNQTQDCKANLNKKYKATKRSLAATKGVVTKLKKVQEETK